MRNKEKLWLKIITILGIWLQGRSPAAHPGAHEGTQAVQVQPLQQVLRQQLLPLAAHEDPSRHQALQMWNMSAQVHPALTSPAAHQDSHWRQAVQVQDTRWQQSHSWKMLNVVSSPVIKYSLSRKSKYLHWPTFILDKTKKESMIVFLRHSFRSTDAR